MINTPNDEELTACYREANGEMHGKAQPLTTQRIFRAMRAAIVKWGTPQPVVREPLTCEWTHNDDDGYWDTSCGKAWGFDDGGPKENNMNFCHCCGKTLRIKGGQHGTDN